jgi:hypothetical protein
MVMTTTVTWLPFMIQAENASLGKSEGGVEPGLQQRRGAFRIEFVGPKFP